MYLVSGLYTYVKLWRATTYYEELRRTTTYNQELQSWLGASRILGDAFEPTNKDHDFFMSFFICLFRDTHILFLLLSFCSLVSFYIARKSDIPFYCCRLSRSDPTYITILGGRQRHLFWRFRGVEAFKRRPLASLLACVFLGQGFPARVPTRRGRVRKIHKIIYKNSKCARLAQEMRMGPTKTFQ